MLPWVPFAALFALGVLAASAAYQPVSGARPARPGRGARRPSQGPRTVGGYRVSSPFGWRVHPTLGGWRFHAGVDPAMPEGTPIYTIASGRVVAVGQTAHSGTYVTIEHAPGWRSSYSHLSAVLVHHGELIDRTRPLAQSGGRAGAPDAGASTGPHLHLQVKRLQSGRWTPVDPLAIIWS